MKRLDVTYDANGNPGKIYFTNGSVTRYIYSTAGEKLRITNLTAVPNITVAIGSARELAPSEILSADSTDYLLGGSLTLRNGRIDKLQFEEGYCQAVEYSGNASQDDFYLYYYDRDHLGNIRQVVKADRTTNGTVVQTMEYYPFGAQFCHSSTASEVQSRKYNGKELDRMHGLDTYDYGARQYNPVTARWDRVDPLCEKYYSVSPYAYCLDNPIKYFDIKGYEPGDFFTSIEDAAIDFGKIFNNNSIIKGREYGSSIFVFYQDGKKGYTYTVPHRGKRNKTHYSEPLYKKDIVARIHTHGSAVDENGIVKNFNYFSCGDDLILEAEKLKLVNNEPGSEKSDIGTANENGYLSFLVSPNGLLQKYDPDTGVISVISNEMPSDKQDKDRRNYIDPERNNINHINNRMLLQINVFFKSIKSKSNENRSNE